MTDAPDLADQIADALRRGDDAACEHAAACADGYASTEQAVVATLDTLMRTRKHVLDRGLFSAAKQRWLHRAAVQGQRWARDRIALEWATHSDPDQPSPYWPYRGWRDESPPPEHAVPAEQTLRWLAAAARRGDRTAAYWAGLMDRDDVESMLTAYGAGVPDEVLDAVELGATAGRLADHYQRSDSDEAGRWFREATEGPEWDEQTSRFTWVQAMAGYIAWAHPRDEARCAALCRLLIDNAVRTGPGDRIEIAEEAHKPLRLDYGRADNNEWDRATVLRHVIDEHCRTTSRQLEVLLALAENPRFGGDGDRTRVSWVLADKRGAPIDLAEVESLAWDLVAVVLREVIPALLRTIRCDNEATEFEAALLPVSFSPAEHLFVPSPPDDYLDPSAELTYGPALEAEHALDRLIGGWGDLRRLLTDTLASVSIAPTDDTEHSWISSAVEDAEAAAALTVIAQCGFESCRTGYQFHGAPSVSAWHWHLEAFRLLRGTDLWLAMWLATSTEPPEGLVRAHSWTCTWQDVSALLLLAARAVVRHGNGLAEPPGYLPQFRFPPVEFPAKPVIEARLDALRHLTAR